MATSLTSARLMVRQAATLLDKQDPTTTTFAAMAKLYTCDLAFEICDQALQMHGGYGYLKDYQIERFLRDVRVHRILEGSDSVMRIIISRNLLKN